MPPQLSSSINLVVVIMWRILALFTVPLITSRLDQSMTPISIKRSHQDRAFGVGKMKLRTVSLVDEQKVGQLRNGNDSQLQSALVEATS